MPNRRRYSSRISAGEPCTRHAASYPREHLSTWAAEGLFSQLREPYHSLDSNCQRLIIAATFSRKSGCEPKDYNMPAEPGSSVLTINELAEYLKISKST